MKFRGLSRGVDSEDDPDKGRTKESEENRLRRDGSRPPGYRRNSERDYPTEHDARQTAAETHDDRFGEKLEKNIRAPCADRLPKADLLRPLRHRDEHDVHN